MHRSGYSGCFGKSGVQTTSYLISRDFLCVGGVAVATRHSKNMILSRLEGRKAFGIPNKLFVFVCKIHNFFHPSFFV